MLTDGSTILAFFQKIIDATAELWQSIVDNPQPMVDYQFPAKIVSVAWVFIVILVGCGDDSTLTKPPPSLLSKQQMVSFLIDLHLTEAKMSYIEVRKTDSLEIIFRNYEKYLMNQHGFTDSIYLQSYAYYLDHMELMDEIYDDVVDSLSVMNSQQKALKLEETGETL